jgi:GNAT superfamily N-acetyltransferase
VLPDIVRHVDQVGQSGIVLFSRLDARTVDAAVAEQIAFFASIDQRFEWKAYAHDEPVDLVQRLAAHGFAIDDPESVMVLDLDSAPRSTATGHDIRRVTRAHDLRAVSAVKQRVYHDDASELLARLAHELEHAPDYLSVYLAVAGDAPAATAWVRFPANSAFASLWGGSTLPEYRHQGLYTALLHARLDEARARGYRYVTVDAGAMSRPILEKRGFVELTVATACTWPG